MSSGRVVEKAESAELAPAHEKAPVPTTEIGYVFTNLQICVSFFIS